MPARYRVEVIPAAQKQLARLPRKDQESIGRKVDALAEDPTPHNAKKLHGGEFHSLRVGHYRIIYKVTHAALSLLVVDIDHRKQVYRGY